MHCCQVWFRMHYLKSFINHQAGLVLDSDVSPILARKMEKAWERRLFSTTSTFNLNDNSLLLVTTAVDPPCYQPSFNLFNSKRRLRSCCKNYSQHEAWQRGDSPTYQPPNSPKPQSSTNFDSNNFLLENTAPEVNKQQDLTNYKLLAEFKGFFGYTKFEHSF